MSDRTQHSKLKRFDVAVRREVVEQAWIEVRAEDEEQARCAALHVLMSDGVMAAWEHVKASPDWIETVVPIEEEDPDHTER